MIVDDFIIIIKSNFVIENLIIILYYKIIEKN